MATLFFKLGVARCAFKPLWAACLATALVWPAQAVLAADAGWPQARHDAAGTSFNAAETTLSPLNLVNIQAQWSSAKNFDVSRVVSAHGEAFVTFSEQDGMGNYQDQLARLDATNGTMVWKVPSPMSFSAVIVQDLVVVVGQDGESDTGLATAFDRATGTVRWSRTLPAVEGYGWLTPATVTSDRIYLSSYDGNVVVVLDAATGGLIWRHTVGHPISLAVAEGKVFVVSDTELITLDATDGREMWRYAVASSTSRTSAPLAVGGNVLIMDYQGRVYSLNALNGQLRWITSSPWSKIASGYGPLASDGVRVYALNGVSRRQLSAIDLASGALQWTAKAGLDAKDVTVANGVVYCMGERLVALHSTTGAAVATPKIKSANPGLGHLTLADGRLFIKSMTKNYDVILQAWGLPAAR